MKRALFIGRFQPLHKGHISVLQDLKKSGIDEVLIGIGSSQYRDTQDNPFSYEERIKLIDLVLADRDDIPEYIVFPISDIHDDALWAEHVKSSMPKKCEYAVTGNEWVRKLLSEGGFVVDAVNMVIDIDATTIR